jgi:hypothetical protein
MVLVDPDEHDRLLQLQQQQQLPQQQQQQHGWRDQFLRLDEQIHMILFNSDLPEDEKAREYLLALKRYIDAHRKSNIQDPIPVRIVSSNVNAGDVIEKDNEEEEDVPPTTAAEPMVVHETKQQEPKPVEKISKRPTITTDEDNEEMNENVFQQQQQQEQQPSFTSKYVLQEIHSSNKQRARPLIEQIDHYDAMKWDPRTGSLLVRGNPVSGSNIVTLMKHLLYTKRSRAPVEPPGFQNFLTHVLRMPLDKTFLDEMRNEHLQEGPPPPQIGKAAPASFCNY